jgi:taurine dioxygenase
VALVKNPLPGAVGAELTGVDVTRADPAELASLVHHEQLLVVRDQRLDPAALAALAASLGELDVYPFAKPMPGHPHVVAIVKNPEDTHNFGGAWHSDTSYLPRPPSLTLLYAVELPPAGGDTLFADMCAALEALSPRLRGVLETLEALNTSALVHGAGADHESVAGQAVAPIEDAAVSEAVHPVVRVHPETGRQALYVSRIHTRNFVGMTREESVPLIDFLQEFAVRPERQSRVVWRPGTLAIWDNRTVQHNPLNDYHGARRVMHRVILKGEQPSGVAALPSSG